MNPFEDIDVLDLTQSIAGLVSTQFLATLGANVVKVEPPQGDAFRGLLDGAMSASSRASRTTVIARSPSGTEYVPFESVAVPATVGVREVPT